MRKFTHFKNDFVNYGASSMSDYQWLRGIPSCDIFSNASEIIVHHGKCDRRNELVCDVSEITIRRGFSFGFTI